ncbi:MULTISPECIES: glutaminyl-peptide cyclotransferase [unclassified Moraxella]|uniref:glutaminyl-peptide cyclotransferase n=1 Tax=unclassified Moraxella TaxID=2685852 RepID=UPI00359E9000
MTHRFFAIFYKIALIALLAPLHQNASANTATLIATHPSDDKAFVQGLEVLDGKKLLMATGLYGKSTIGIFDLDTQHHTIKDTLRHEFFGEGATITPYGIWQLTWRENVAFLRNLQTFKIVRNAHYAGEGWGLAYDDITDRLYMSDGTDSLQIRHAKTFELISTLPVRYQGRSLKFINELEFANGFIYANIWQTNLIIKINPKNGNVVQFYDLTDILQNANFTQEQRQKIDVLNGIAHINGNRFYVTGKFYPLIFEVELP